MGRAEYIAEKEVTEFLSNYLGLLDFLLEGVQEQMSQVVESVSEGIQKIDKSSLATVDANGVKREFMNQMEAAVDRDEKINDLIFEVIGSLSADDVIRQRLEHIIDGMNRFGVLLGQWLEKGENRIQENVFREFIDKLKSEMFSSFTMENEKIRFERFFPKASGL